MQNNIAMYVLDEIPAHGVVLRGHQVDIVPELLVHVVGHGEHPAEHAQPDVLQGEGERHTQLCVLSTTPHRTSYTHLTRYKYKIVRISKIGHTVKYPKYVDTILFS